MGVLPDYRHFTIVDLIMAYRDHAASADDYYKAGRDHDEHYRNLKARMKAILAEAKRRDDLATRNMDN